jgi:hypothetical protein
MVLIWQTVNKTCEFDEKLIQLLDLTPFEALPTASRAVDGMRHVCQNIADLFCTCELFLEEVR